MADRTKFIFPILLILILLLSGCETVSKSVSSIGKIFNKNQQAKEPKDMPTQVERSKAALLKQIDRKYENPKAHFKLGQLYQADSLWSKAENCYRICLNFDPVHGGAQAARIKVLQLSGDAKKAELLTDIYMEQAGVSAAGSLKLAIAFQKEGLDDSALACYNQASRLAPNSAKIHRQIGYYYLSKNELVQAQDYLHRSFQLNPNQPEVAGELGRLGVAVRIPRRTEKDTRKLDKIVEKSEAE